MKLLRHGPPGRERPGLVDGDGAIRDLSGIVADIDKDSLAPSALDELRSVDPAGLPVVAAGSRLGACVGAVGNFLAVGLNYADHAAETGSPVPTEPAIFNKAPSCISGPNDAIIIPRESQKTDWEVELAIVIGKRATYVSEAAALDHVAGYCVCDDVSEREFQLERGGQTTKGKSAPSFGPLGPWLVTADEVADVQKLDMWLDVDGRRMQTGSTATMIFGVAELVSYISRFMILEPGDVITTGTPPGVGLGMKPPRFLKPGEVVTLGITGLGEQRHDVVACA